MAVKIICNLTPKRITVVGEENNRLVLAPLERGRIISEGELDQFNYKALSQLNLIQVEDKIEVNKFGWLAPFSGVALMLFFMVGVNVTKSNPELVPWYWYISGGTIIVIIGLGALLSWKGPPAMARMAAQVTSLLLILLIGIGVPAFSVYHFGHGKELFGGEPSYAQLLPILQLIFIVTASLLPALLYFLFDRQCLDTLREKFERQIFRLDPDVQTLTDVRAKYGRQMEEVYGADNGADVGRLIRGTRWPIFVATLVITLGWLLALPPARLAISDSEAELFKLFIPRANAVTFGFLGAYFFALNMVLRRYARGDLKPKAYSAITVRILIVFILAWVIGLMFTDGNRYELALMFLIGIVPETGLTFIQESIRSKGKLGNYIPSLQEKHPLTNLEGIDLYDRSRLLDEGVTNIESLAHHDLIDLMLETRIPVPRLVDWIDQAVLYLHLMVTNDKESPEAIGMRMRLRRYGIRTVTDLEKAYSAALERGNDEKNRLLSILSGVEGPQAVADETLYRIRTIMDTIQDDEWVDYVRHWRNHDRTPDLEIAAHPNQPIRIREKGGNEPAAMGASV